MELRTSALNCLTIKDPYTKCLEVNRLRKAYLQGQVSLQAEAELSDVHLEIPGRPSQPTLVDPRLVKRRSMATPEGRSALLHALAHIEFNAINLALDAIWRFASMPNSYYVDWLKVAQEESLHFELLQNHLQENYGISYGHFPAHSSLWEMVQKTTGDVLARMALVPRTMESRGLDAVPAIRDRFTQIHDQPAVEILNRILKDEVGHVEIGNRWFNYLCTERKLNPIEAYANLAVEYQAPILKGPFNLEARRAAGFTEEELQVLQGFC